MGFDFSVDLRYDLKIQRDDLDTDSVWSAGATFSSVSQDERICLIQLSAAVN